MNPITTTFTRDGWTFEQVARAGQVAIYRKTKPPMRSWTYEVVVLKIRPQRVVCGKPLSQSEAFPSSEDWGQAGWSYCDLASAIRRFDKLVKCKTL